MSLEENLVSLAEAEDRRSLVLALCACARLQLPRAQQIDPFNATIVETAAAWARGERTVQQIRDVLERAENTRGGMFPTACVRVITAGPVELENTVRLFARQLATSLWMTSEEGERWAAKAGPLASVGNDPKAREGIATVDARLCELVAATVSLVPSARRAQRTGLEELLLAWSSEGKLRPLVRAALACAPRSSCDPAHARFLRIAEEWLLGLRTLDEARAVAEEARHHRHESGIVVRVIAATAEERAELLRRFAEHVWAEESRHASATEDGVGAMARLARDERWLMERAQRAAEGIWMGKIVLETAVAPTGRFEATAELSPTIFEQGFSDKDARTLQRARREQGPVRIFTAAGALVATLEPPAKSWSFGAHLAFGSNGDELFVDVHDRHRIDVFARGSDGAWTQRSSVEIPRSAWSERQPFSLVDDDHLWASGRLFRRAGAVWEERARCPKPKAATAGLSTVVWGDGPIEVRSGGAYEWPERAVISLPTNAHSTAITLEAEGRELHLIVERFEIVVENRPGVGWVQREPISPERTLRIEQAAPGPDALEQGAADAIPWQLGVPHPVGTFLNHTRFGVGVVIDLDRERKTMKVRFREGDPRTFKVSP